MHCIQKITCFLIRINKAVFVSVYTAKSDTFNKLAEEEIEEYEKYKSSTIQVFDTVNVS